MKLAPGKIWWLLRSISWEVRLLRSLLKDAGSGLRLRVK
uniref:Uncharacterized protein n=1 Tax=Manihot esculenta TaxID=3983 RepID=A0A2C9WBX4_MANES